jgi:hypothetical protein
MPDDDAPLAPVRLLEIDDPDEGKDSRPWGEVTESARTLWTEGAELEVVRSALHDDAYTVRAAGPVQFGLPGLESHVGEVYTRDMAARLAAERGRERTGGDTQPAGAPYRPVGVPRGIHPKTLSSLGEQRHGINARGRKTLLSETHSTIINGESRSYVYPDVYPYTAVCKLYSSYQPTAGGSWVGAGEATGYLIGRNTLMTSGHVGPPTHVPWRIQVIPACWNGQSVFGAGFVSYVRSFWSWHSDSGSDIKICQLFDPIGDRVGYFGYRGYNSSWEDGDYWTMAGFPYDWSLTYMTHETAIAVRDDDDGDDINVNGTSHDTIQVESDADEASGVSGAPLWGWWDDGPYAIGVHHGVERDGTVFGTEILSCASGGNGFVAAAGWGRSLWG